MSVETIKRWEVSFRVEKYEPSNNYESVSVYCGVDESVTLEDIQAEIHDWYNRDGELKEVWEIPEDDAAVEDLAVTFYANDYFLFTLEDFTIDEY